MSDRVARAAAIARAGRAIDAGCSGQSGPLVCDKDEWEAIMGLYEFEAKTIEGRSELLEAYRGKVVLVVNVASQCGFTPQYAGLEALYRRLRDRGFEILGFPCDQFGHQEPGDEREIQSFCSTKYDVTFPMFAKIEVNGDGAHPVYQFLKSESPGILGTQAIKWNFTKFLVDRDGRVVERYGSIDTPEKIGKDVEALL
jgi:glutathione peroxidase